MTKPAYPSIEWAGTAGATIGTPPTALQQLGWSAGEQPAAAHVNWKLNKVDEWIQWADAYFGGIDGQLFANAIRPYGTSLQDGIYLPGTTYAVDIRALGALGVRLTVNTAASTWTWNAAGTMTGVGWTGINWGTSVPAHTNLAASPGASGLRYAYPAASRPTMVYDVSPFAYPFSIPQAFQATSGTDPSTGQWTLRNYGGGTRSPRATAPFPRGAQTSDTSATMALTGLSAVLTKDGTVTEVYFRVRRRTIASWGTTADVASVSSASPTWSGSVVLDFDTYMYWLEFEADSASAGSTNGLTAERCTVTLTPYSADV